MAAKRSVKKFLRITGISFGILLVLLTGFHFWFKAYAKYIIEDLVESKSNGKLKLRIGKFHFGYFSRKMEMENAVFYSADSTNTSYRFSVNRLKIEVQAILPIIFKKRLLIDSLRLINPDIVVTRERASVYDTTKNKKEISIPEEMGKVYHSIQDALEILKVTRFQIDNGKFTLVNKIHPAQLPLSISGINIHIDNIIVDTTNRGVKEKLFFSDNVVLHCFHQNIIFPDGRHRLSFSQFRINLRKKVVELDSCTIAATRRDSSSSSFNVFMDALYLNNINFDTLYRHEVIKADSVYCINPKFNLDVRINKKNKSAKSPPILENIIKQLTGDLQLGFLVVANADFNIKTEKNGNPSSFTFNRNNFEMQGVSIDREATKPIKVRNFTMAIHNYENFIKDSSYSVKFDSVLFRDDRIYLSNFIFHKLDNGRIINTFNVPRLNLGGLSWDDLVFEKRIKAEQATLFNPYISYTVSQKQKKNGGKSGIYQSLGSINDYMDLNYLEVENGNINLDLKSHLLIKLEQASFSIQSHALLASRELAEIKNSLTKLSFKKGSISAGNLNIMMKGIRYIGQSGQFAADGIEVSDNKNNSGLFFHDVAVQKMKVDEKTGSVTADTISWQQADVKINIAGGKNNSSPSVELRNVRGFNTNLNMVLGNKNISSTFDSISWDNLGKTSGNKLKLSGLFLKGKQLLLKDSSMNVSVAGYQIADQKDSHLQQVTVNAGGDQTNTGVSIPYVSFIPHVQSLINSEIAIDNIAMTRPVIRIHPSAVATQGGRKLSWPKIEINQVSMSQPDIEFGRLNDKNAFSFSWHGNQDSSNFLLLSGIRNEAGNSSLTIEDIGLNLSDFAFASSGRKAFHSGTGKITAEIRDAGITRQNNSGLEWKAFITSLTANNFRFDSLGRSGGSLLMNSAVLNELNISSTLVNDMQKLAALNPALQISRLTGHFTDSEKSLWWYNAKFERKNNMFSLDSFSFRQELGLDSFISKLQFQKDYINTKTGALAIGPIDIDQYLKDSIMRIGTIKADHVLVTDFKDKKLPFQAGIIKPLPVNMIKQISLPLSIDSILLSRSNIVYSEAGDKIKKTGTISVNRVTAQLTGIKNQNFSPADSLRILITGYLEDSVRTVLGVAESYADTSGGFLMTVQMKAADATVLNPVLIPLGSFKITRGSLDTLSMTAIGREYAATGEMKMFYHDLKIRILKDADEGSKSFLNSLLNFFANSVVVRNKNTNRSGKVFFIRNRDRSAINYLIKIALSGIASSVGVKATRKAMRRYYKTRVIQTKPAKL